MIPFVMNGIASAGQKKLFLGLVPGPFQSVSAFDRNSSSGILPSDRRQTGGNQIIYALASSVGRLMPQPQGALWQSGRAGCPIARFYPACDSKSGTVGL